MLYHVICHLIGGQFRGGHYNQGHTAYEPGTHTPAQLTELLHDPHHTVIIGGAPLTEAHIAALTAPAAAEPQEAEKPAEPHEAAPTRKESLHTAEAEKPAHHGKAAK